MQESDRQARNKQKRGAAKNNACERASSESVCERVEREIRKWAKVDVPGKKKKARSIGAVTTYLVAPLLNPRDARKAVQVPPHNGLAEEAVDNCV